MNSVIICGRLTADPKISYGQGENSAVARFTVAVERKFKREGQPTADFINCVAFGRRAEFAEKYLHKGIKMNFVGHIQTGNYTNKDGQKVYTTDVIIDDQEFCESKNASQQNAETAPAQTESAPAETNDGFMSVNDGIADDDLPFK